MDALPGLTWHAVYSKGGKEEVAQFHLQVKGLQVFLPLLLLPRLAPRRQRIVPLFPNYFFVRMRFAQQFQSVLWSPGIKRIVGVDGEPASVDDKLIDFLMAQANPDGLIVARSNVKTNQEIQIAAGPFTGLAGIIEAPPDGKGRVKVLMNLLNRRVRVDVPVEYLSSGWTAN